MGCVGVDYLMAKLTYCGKLSKYSMAFIMTMTTICGCGVGATFPHCYFLSSRDVNCEARILGVFPSAIHVYD